MKLAKNYCLFSTASLGVLLVCTAGCGSGKPDPVPVRGTVTLDGEPLADAIVSFMPTDPNGLPAVGRTDSQGVFILTTHQTGDGALPGDYKVVVTKESAQDPLGGGLEPGEHHSTADIMARNTRRSPGGRAKLREARKKLPPSPVPSRYREVKTTPLHETVPPAREVRLDLQSKG